MNPSSVSLVESKSGLCIHDKIKKHCRDCEDSFCHHEIPKIHCKDCGGSGLCDHDKIKRKCRDCGDSLYRPHEIPKMNVKIAEEVVFVNITK